MGPENFVPKLVGRVWLGGCGWDGVVGMMSMVSMGHRNDVQTENMCLNNLSEKKADA